MSKDVTIGRSKTGLPAWNAFRHDVDDLFDAFSGSFQALRPFSLDWPKSAGGLAPAVDVTETEKAYTIAAELPGVSEQDIDVSVHDGSLVIKGEKHQEKEEKAKNRYLSERSYGAFQRVFGLPKGTDESKIEAQFHNGVLTVTVPKNAEIPNSRKVDVKAV